MAALSDSRLLLLSPDDNVLVACVDLVAGDEVSIDGASAVLSEDVRLGHKIARSDLPAGEKVVKYGAPIGSVSQPVARAQWVHVHNMRSDYIPTYGTDVGDQPLEGH